MTAIAAHPEVAGSRSRGPAVMTGPETAVTVSGWRVARYGGPGMPEAWRHVGVHGPVPAGWAVPLSVCPEPDEPGAVEAFAAACVDRGAEVRAALGL